MDGAKLLVVSGPLEGFSYVVRPGERLDIGRDRDTAIRLKGTKVSRRHAQLQFSADGRDLTITDLGSRNGTSINDQPIPANTSTALAEGQRIQIGDHTLRVTMPGTARPSTPARPEAPRVSSRFQSLTPIARGSQARVWSAYDTQHQRRVAIKILSQVPLTGTDDYERFRREAEICCRLSSRHLVHVYEFAVPEGSPPYMVMEYVDGPTAWRLSQERCLDLPTVLRLGVHLARALTAIAKAGIVHRDVKPGNLLVDSRGVGRLTDFGIAKIAGARTLTQTGWGIGSLPFTAPEQAINAKEADFRADLYGLGACLYTMLVSRPPFVLSANDSEGLRSLLRTIESDPPPPIAALRPDAPPGLVSFIGQLMAKAPEERPPSAEVALARLIEFRRAHGSASADGVGLV